MPQLQVVQPQQGSAPLQPASRENFGRAGEALINLSQQMTQFNQAMDNVAKYRAEAAAADVDTQLQGLKQEMTANPNGLIGDAWKAEYDKRAAAIRDKAAKTPFIHQGVFGQKTKLSTDIHKLELGSASTQVTLASGKQAFDAKLTKLADDFARSDDPNERALIQANMQIAVQGAAIDGFIMPTEQEKYLREVRNEGYLGAFARLNNADPEKALDFVEEHYGDMPVRQAESLNEKAINEIVARQTLILAQERAQRAKDKEYDRLRNKDANSRLTLDALTGSFGLDRLLEEQGEMDTEGQRFWMRYYQNNPTGRAPTPKHDNLLVATPLELEIRGLDGKPPDQVEAARATLINRVNQSLAMGDITQSTWRTFLDEIEQRDVNPAIEAVEKAVRDVTLIDYDKQQAGFSARMEMRQYVRDHPNQTEQQYWQKGLDILHRYDLFDIGAQHVNKPDWYVFDNGFQYEDSLATVEKAVAAGRITREQGDERLRELSRYKKMLDAQDAYKNFGGRAK